MVTLLTLLVLIIGLTIASWIVTRPTFWQGLWIACWTRAFVPDRRESSGLISSVLRFVAIVLMTSVLTLCAYLRP